MGTITSNFSFRGFSNLDASPEADYLINSMRIMGQAPESNKIKEKLIRKLGIQEGESILDLGCGLGYDINLFAKAVGNSGRAVGIDNSKKMLEIAQKNFGGQNVEFILADANNLSFLHKNTFDYCHIERLLLSQKNPYHTVDGAIAVLKKKGKLCITEPDFKSITLRPFIEKQTDIAIKYWQTLVKHPFIGLDLVGMLSSKGLSIADHKVNTYETDNYKTFTAINPFDRMLEDMIHQGLLPVKSADRMLKELRKAVSFFYSIDFHAVIAEKM